MGLVGMGRAFNLRFTPNGPLRTNCYHRPMPRIGIFGGGGGGNVSYTENITYQNGPTGFWGFMTGLTQGLFGGGMFGCGMGGGLFGLLNSRKAAPQGTDQAQAGEDKHLKNLIDFYGNKYTIRSHPDKEGIYQAVPKEGNKIIEGTYQQLCDILSREEDKKPEIKNDPVVQKKEKEPIQQKVEKDEVQDTGNRVKPNELKNGADITVMDEVWDLAHPNANGHIDGKTKLSGEKNAEGFDKLITIGGKRYQLQNEKVDGDPVYKSIDGKEGDTYRLSKQDGRLVLIQSASDAGKLHGVGTTDYHR